jgi:hypothetical protein
VQTKGFWQQGRFVQGATVRTAGTFSTSQLELEVAAAVARARETGQVLAELKALLTDHPQLRVDTPEQVWNSETKSWDGATHLLTPLAHLYAELLLGS